MPEALTRTNALLAGQVDLIETPAPDAVPQLKSAGMKIVDNVTPHVWNYHLSVLPGSPWTDIRLRKALNLAIDREGVVGLMNGLAKPAKGQVDPSSPWFGKPSFEIKYDLAEAKKLVKEAGYSKEKPLKTTFVIATGGTGQMLSLPMNEYLQQSFKEIGIDVEFKVVELEALYTAWRKGAADEINAGITSNNIAYVTSDPLYAIVRFFHSGQVAPVGVNWGGYKNPKVDALIDEAKQNFDVAKQDELLAQAHAHDRRRRRAGLGGARHQPARAVAEGEEVRAGAALVSGSDDDRAGVASRSRYGAVGKRASRGLLGRRAVVPHTDGVQRSWRDEPRSKHQGGTTMEHYAGIDVSLECSSVCVVDGSGKIIREGKVASEPAALIGWFGSLGLDLDRIGLEAGRCRNGFMRR